VKTVAIYPGSFDPFTLGHQSVLLRAAELFSEVIVLVVHNPNKKPLFSAQERVDQIKSHLREITNVGVSSLDSGLLVDFAKTAGAKAIIKGFRTVSDIEYEIPMAQVNKDLSGIETVFIAAEPGFGYVSSSLVKEVASLGGDVTSYVSREVAAALGERFAK
jgi:pantetheine-phosphate adenylyltransferase